VVFKHRTPLNKYKSYSPCPSLARFIHEVHDNVGWVLGDGFVLTSWNDVWCRDTFLFFYDLSLFSYFQGRKLLCK